MTDFILVFFFFLFVIFIFSCRVAHIEHDCAQLRSLRLPSASPSVQTEHLTTAIPVQKLCDTSWSSRSANSQRQRRTAGAVCERIGSHGAEFRPSGGPDSDIEDADGILRDAQGTMRPTWGEKLFGKLIGFLHNIGSDTECEKKDIPVDAVHWKVGKGAHRDAARGAEAEP